MILVVGSTGLLGFEICNLLASKGKSFRAMVREGSNAEKIKALKALGAEIITGDLKDYSSLVKACGDIEAIISTASSTFSRREGDSIETVDLKGQLNLVKAAEMTGVNKFVFISFMRDPYSDYSLDQAKEKIESALRNSSMNWTSLQASFFMEVWLSPALGFDYPNNSARIYGNGNEKVGYISIKDVAKFAVEALTNPIADRSTLRIGGPDTISLGEVVGIFEKVSGKAFTTEQVPISALEAQKNAATDPLQDSFCGIMIQYAHGDQLFGKELLDKMNVTPISIEEYARSVYS